MFEVADIYEAMRFLGCTYAEAVAWLEAEQKYFDQELAWDAAYYAQ